MKRVPVLIILLFICVSCASSQSQFRAVFYNVENLFDTKDDPTKNDNEFLPDGVKTWTPYKYWEKLKNISRVITAIGGMQSPAIVGLCEVENDSVIFDLTRRSSLKAQNYKYIVTDSPDSRGIDLALLYQPDQFKLLHYNEYEVLFKEKRRGPTRNILHATGRVINGDSLDIFLCHFPSRAGGQQASEPARIEVAELLRTKVDSLFVVREKANIIIMGDFNDHPDDKSIFQILKARSINYFRDDYELYNLFFHRIKERDFGTYYYRGKWEILDQIIVSGNMLRTDNPITIKNSEAHIFKPDFLLETDKSTGNKKPRRTYVGPTYIGGFSDHLPVYVDLLIK